MIWSKQLGWLRWRKIELISSVCLFSVPQCLRSKIKIISISLGAHEKQKTNQSQDSGHKFTAQTKKSISFFQSVDVTAGHTTSLVLKIGFPHSFQVMTHDRIKVTLVWLLTAVVYIAWIIPAQQVLKSENENLLQPNDKSVRVISFFPSIHYPEQHLTHWKCGSLQEPGSQSKTHLMLDACSQRVKRECHSACLYWFGRYPHRLNLLIKLGSVALKAVLCEVYL